MLVAYDGKPMNVWCWEGCGKKYRDKTGDRRIERETYAEAYEEMKKLRNNEWPMSTYEVREIHE